MVWVALINPPGRKTKGKMSKKTKKGKVPKASKKGESMARKKGRNPKGYPKTARGKAWRALVKKHGVLRAAGIWRRTKKPAYAANEWKGDRKGHKVASLAGWARRKGVPVPKYLHAAGVSQAQISRYIGKHGAVGGRKRAYTKTHPVPARKRYASNPAGYPKTARGKAWRALVKKHGVMRAAGIWRRTKKPAYAANAWPGDPAGHRAAALKGWETRRGYAANPVATAVETVKGVFAIETVYTVLTVSAGFAGMALGNAVVKKLKADAGTPLIVAGEISGSILAGAAVAVGTKNVRRGLITAGSGIALSVFKVAWNRIVPATILGLEMPRFSDYVELPYAAGMEDYVELPYAAGYADVGQFLPPEAAELGQAYQTGMEQFIPEQFGEYTVGIGEEAEVEY